VSLSKNCSVIRNLPINYITMTDLLVTLSAISGICFVIQVPFPHPGNGVWCSCFIFMLFLVCTFTGQDEKSWLELFSSFFCFLLLDASIFLLWKGYFWNLFSWCTAWSHSASSIFPSCMMTSFLSQTAWYCVMKMTTCFLIACTE
jgi:hypothetical protein